MQARRNRPQQTMLTHRFGAGARPDVIALNAPVGREHGSRTALVRALLSMTLVAGGLGAVLLNAGTDLGRAEASTDHAGRHVAELTMPRPRVQALSPEAPRPAVDQPELRNSEEALTASATFAAVHDLDAKGGGGPVDRVSYDFLLSQTATGDPNDILTFGPMKIRRHIVQTVVKAAQTVQTDPVLLMAIADKESSFITAVQAKTSSATGLYQFIERTWLGVIRDFGPQYGLAKEAALVSADGTGRPIVTNQAERLRVLEMRRDPYLSAIMAGEMLKRDADKIAQTIGRELTLGEIYLAHFLGPTDAENFLAHVADKPRSAAAALLPGPARANRSIFFAAGSGRGRRAKVASLSVAQVHEKFEAMMSTRGDRYRDVTSVAGIMALADEAGQ